MVIVYGKISKELVKKASGVERERRIMDSKRLNWMENGRPG